MTNEFFAHRYIECLRKFPASVVREFVGRRFAVINADGDVSEKTEFEVITFSFNERMAIAKSIQNIARYICNNERSGEQSSSTNNEKPISTVSKESRNHARGIVGVE